MIMADWSSIANFLVFPTVAGASASVAFYLIRIVIEDHSRIAANETYIQNFDKHFDKIDQELGDIKNELKELQIMIERSLIGTTEAEES
ncbi:hypothetical protein [Thermococcus sp. GR6]|uniref:hypothetical protein n=1 Tax=Thermococcus sp. GR6 TaxID=1638256 RepID=UPI00143159A0|nr:hypothetical protein [Thermococcus sp. GR6]NJE42485.1 hypothetical protein [Thermococcus sp. GR6]